jgi:sulfide:quinone oxidoreductase
MSESRKHVLVLGGGFAGVQAAIEAAKAGGFRVTLVSDRDYLHLFPTSIWIPTRTVALDKTRVPLAAVAKSHRFDLVISAVEKIDAERQTVVLAQEELTYDYLVVALGPGRATPQGAEHIHSLCDGPQAALDIRDRLDALIAKGGGSIAIGFGGNPKDKSAVRGGPAFEFIFNVHHMLRRAGVRDRFTVNFFAPMENPGNRMGEKAAAMMPGRLAKAGIPMHTGVPIEGFDEQGVKLANGTRIDADLVMFIPGAVGHPVVRTSGLPVNDAGFLVVDGGCLVSGTANVYAAGDSAALEGPEWRAKQGHIAEVMGRVAAHNIIAAEKGAEERESYVDHVTIVCLLDTGNGGMMVYRTTKRSIVVPLPVVGHWMKQAWGTYARVTKMRRVGRLPGM